MASLAEIRARLAAADSSKQGNRTSNGGNAIYPHWNMEEGKTATVRFLPDANPKNTFFWIEQAMIRLPFNGIKGQDSQQVIVPVPCAEMWNDTCPILTEVRPWFKDSSLEEMARKYWKKRQWIFQGFVRENPITEDSTPENPIRRFLIGPQIFNIIKAALMDPELEELPTDYMHGLDFRVTKTSKGGYADYNTSNWARRESTLTDFEAEAIEKYGLFDLASFLPKRPGDVELKVIKEMFEESVNGKPYDIDRWGQYYRPAGVTAPAATSTTNSAEVEKTENVAVSTVTETYTDTESAPFDIEEPATVSSPIVEEKPTTNAKAEDILALIRSRNNKA